MTQNQYLYPHTFRPCIFTADKNVFVAPWMEFKWVKSGLNWMPEVWSGCWLIVLTPFLERWSSKPWDIRTNVARNRVVNTAISISRIFHECKENESTFSFQLTTNFQSNIIIRENGDWRLRLGLSACPRVPVKASRCPKILKIQWKYNSNNCPKPCKKIIKKSQITLKAKTTIENHKKAV